MSQLQAEKLPCSLQAQTSRDGITTPRGRRAVPAATGNRVGLAQLATTSNRPEYQP
jgi:hypothetical protein